MGAATNGARDAEEVLLNLDALEPPEEQPPFTFQAGGKIWELASPERLDFREQHRLQGGDNYDILEALMGPEQWTEFVDVELESGRKIDDDVVKAIIAGAGKHYGIDLPESPASPVSSNRAARRSKQTSRKRTANASKTSPRAR